MKNLLFTLILNVIVALAFSSEICDNGIDDDGDGLIDLNDSDCNCNTVIEVPSLIPNHDFEDYSTCPTTISQLDRCNDWIQASNASSDYFNTCDYDELRFNIEKPQNGSPSGNGYVGFINTKRNNKNYKEYIGACLASPLLAGTTYKIKLLLGFGVSIDGNTQSLPNFNITLFGNPDCSSIPFNNNSGFDCPLQDGTGFIQLATKNVLGNNEWVDVELTFTPSANMNVLVIGPDCFPSSLSLNINSEKEYYYLDELLINEKKLFNNFLISKIGKYCTNNIVLEASLKASELAQWYKDGVALVGEISNTLSIDTGDHGNYQCVITDANNDCFVSNTISIHHGNSSDCEDALIHIPNSFTPDNDNTNDFFKPEISNPEKIIEYTFQIFDRWGELVFESKNPLNTAWNGFYKSKKCPSGIYSWKLFIKDDTKIKPALKFGHLSLIK